MEITVFRTVSQQEMSLREIKLMSDFYLTTDIEKYRDNRFARIISQYDFCRCSCSVER